MEDNYTLKLDFLHYWRSGTGKGSGSHVDSTVDTNEYGCPFVGGNMLKGLLRDAVFKTVSWQCADKTDDDQPDPVRITEILFGSSGFHYLNATSNTTPGIIRMGNATLPADTQRWLSEKDAHRNAMFRDLYATAIDAKTGSARKGSLRGQQVVIPLELSAPLSIAHVQPVDSEDTVSKNRNWVYARHRNLIRTALPVIRAVGSGRTRGLGRVRLSLEAS